ncbi:MAG: hypothetical protein HYV76_02065 [Candidatus Vogelbacteria bacterium]|nr:hypothetical protein [Candidatus Vogelbacteria bacterium]
MPPTKAGSDPGQHLQEVNEELYKRNLDLAVRNKTLSLLRELYQISILTLEPKDLAAKIASTVQLALDLEIMGIFIFDEDKTHLVPLSVHESEKVIMAEKSLGYSLKSLIIPVGPGDSLLSQVLAERGMRQVLNLKEIWDGAIESKMAEGIETRANIHSSLVYPLGASERLMGVLIVSLNRTFEELSQFEKESIDNFVNIIAVALDKAILYQQIQIANTKLKELDRQKTEFVSIAAHQLRSPLTAIKGYSSMVLEGSFGEINDKAREAIDRVFQSSQRLVNVIEDFLNVTRIELGTMKYELTDFNIADVARRVLEELKPNIEKQGLSAIFKADNGDHIVHGDVGKVSQVIGNVIDNAIKYTSQGSIELTLTSTPELVTLAIKDTGDGIAKESLPKLFQKFIRADDAGKLNIKGTGLGLYVARQIIEGHHGRIWAESEGKGHGSTFLIELKKKW